jgi:oligopeptide transport system substrate-binding protein
MRAALRSLAVVLMASMVLVACGGSATPTAGGGTSNTATASTASGGSVFRFAAQYQPDTMDPAAAQTVLEYQLLSLVYDALFTYNTDQMTLKNQLAASYAWSADGRTLDIKLKPNVHFSNGDPVTAQDVAFSIQRNLDPAVKSTYAASYFGLVGAQDYYNGKSKTVPGIQVVSPTEIKFQLTDPQPYFLNVLALQNSFILDHNLPGDTASVSAHPLGSGPFVLKNWVQNESMTFVRNPKYDLGAPPKIDGVQVTFGPDSNLQVLQFEKGEQDAVYGIASTNYLQIINDPQWKQDYVQVPLPSVYFLRMNPGMVPAFQKVQVRQAMNYAIDKNKVIQDVENGRGTVANGPLPPGIPGYNSSVQPYPYDPAKAKQLLAQAGYANGFTVEFDLVPSDTGTKLAQVVQSMLAQVGVTMNIVNMQSAPYHQKYLAKQIPFGIGDWLLDYPDAEDFLYLLVDGHSPLNRTTYDNPQFDQLVEKADSITDQAQRVQLYAQADALANQDAPWVYLWFGVYDGLFQPWVQPRTPDILLNPILYTVWDQISISPH